MNLFHRSTSSNMFACVFVKLIATTFEIRLSWLLAIQDEDFVKLVAVKCYFCNKDTLKCIILSENA